MAYAEELANRVRAIAKLRPTVTEKKMFGGLAFMLNGYMFCGISQDSLMGGSVPTTTVRRSPNPMSASWISPTGP